MVESEECTENVGRELELEISIQQDGDLGWGTYIRMIGMKWDEIGKAGEWEHAKEFFERERVGESYIVN